jgi:hypothetical protein
MKRIFTLLAAIFLMATGWAQSPQKMSYQAVIRDATNHLVITQVGMKISILQGSAAGTLVFAETQTPTPNVNGLVTIEIGSGTPVTGTIAGINWSNGPYFIKTETDPAGGIAYSITGSSELLSVPYALYANTAGGHYIGELFGGGIVVSVWKTAGVEHGLVASLADISAALAWSNIVNASAGATSALDGVANTAAILLQSATAPASLACINHAGGGFNDWYLPSIWELKECYNAGYVVNTILGATNGFKFAAYWSSTENSATQAWYLLFNTGIMGSDAAKGNNGIVRAVRKF